MQTNHNVFLVNHTQDIIQFLDQSDFIEQNAVITNPTEDSPLKILVQMEPRTYFAVCTDNLKTTIKFTRAILNVTPEQIDFETLKKEVKNG